MKLQVSVKVCKPSEMRWKLVTFREPVRPWLLFAKVSNLSLTGGRTSSRSQ
ncbi:MAG: hypothetical protein ACLQLC_20450 [Candidatus Sulfotelmatobacter sp.]